ncbi:4'-phosphopantetheinyl transferase family protein [Variovorax paradoxus]|uniref:4'-phosphopantetheinyl transferase family protein n=1 Tax=Variovorax paradoxus TaxID=34073 RepID=UPI0024810803|nr:4'-phosphopantetheinyl transferase superfamily protein [Variovorax paradoxus]WGT62995.1 4'-phosphopantetheinyl transferase superfamily protein [Variovorax paradoxus]
MRLMPWPDPVGEGIEVHCLHFDLAAEPLAARQQLTHAERAKADRFARTADRVRFTETRAALRRLLAGRVGCEPAEVPIASGPHGKPYLDLAGSNAPLFNLSHSGAHALIVLGDAAVASAVGVDIEECKADVDAEAVASLAFTERECNELHAAADRLHALYSRWVAKEAVLKAIGVGVAEHLKSIGIHHGAEGKMALECAVPEWTNFKAVALQAPSGYAAAIAWRAKEPT